MKFLVVFAAIAAVAFGYPATNEWTLHDLSEVLQNPQTHPALIPYLEAALNEMMEALMAGEQIETITVDMPIIASYTLQELVDVIQDPNTDPAHLPFYESALNEFMVATFAGEQLEFITVVIPPNLPKPEVPVAIPEGPVAIPEVMPEPSPVEMPAASSPLVQIIVNVKQQQDIQTPITLPAIVPPFEDVEVAPTPVQVVEGPQIPVVRPVLPALPIGTIHPRN